MGDRSCSVAIVDDEPLARRRLRRMLEACPGVHCVGAAADLSSAQELVQRSAPDILLLDIQMPGGDGFELLGLLGTQPPLVIFVTAFDRHAIRAFEVHAVDYLLKPVEPERLGRALDRARALVLAREGDRQVPILQKRIAELAEALKAPGQDGSTVAVAGRDEITELWIRSLDGYTRVATRHISRIHAERDYVRIHADGQAFLHWESMASLEARLSAQEFVRVHRGSIVRHDCIAHIRRGAFSNWVVELKDGSLVPVGRTYLSRVRAQFKLEG
ncbi:response regulator transcription factor [Diaphorobacter ruginosibacter]|uniref:Response regulator transcription factor n=1 Tax=Diaphorobacter ruginosibacter TaxID=1715720 RepID=A0A7G9RTP8_9BURK|nr:LytTR family DNA-binding domain-containing protein [Diaphorobacter ruginosibacter]QNN58973.1 response regulator transcription factor [Diaphorobacter ruginosibacter]